MRDEFSQGDAASGRDEIRDLPTLLRAAADGELTAAEQARLDEHLSANEGDQARLAFERGLKTACGRAMGGGRCPDALRASVERIAAESHPAYAAGVGARAEETRSASFWSSPRFGRVLGAAAAVVLMIGVGAVLVTQSGTGGAPTGGAGEPARDLQLVAYRDEITQFVAKEHGRCWESEDAADRKFKFKDRDAVVSEFRSLLGGEMHIPALDQPVESIVFRGAGRCHLPKTEGSAHLRWDIPATAETKATAVSMFVAPDNGMLELHEGVTYAVNTAECGVKGSSVLLWRQDGSLFCLISETETGACNKFRKQMGAPEETEGL